MAQVGKVSQYDVLEKIAENGFAIVYKGRDPFTKRWVAIKMCIAEDDSLRAHFLRQAEGISKLFHPNIARILDFGSGEGKPYLVEEFLEGVDLRARIRAAADVELVEELDILLQVAHGLQYAHSKGVLHLDLKPATVHVERGGTVKLVDFGLARLSGAAIRLGKPDSGRPPRGYLPPELALGLQPDERTDIYCFGALAYELLARRTPFTGLTPPEVLQESLDETLKPLPREWPECPPALAALVDRCLHKSPGDRYLDFDALLDDLEPIQDTARLAAGRRRDDSTTGSLLAAAAQRAEATIPGVLKTGGSGLGGASVAPERPSLDDTMAIPPDGATLAHGSVPPPGLSAETQVDLRSGGTSERRERLTTACILDLSVEGDDTQLTPPPSMPPPPPPTPGADAPEAGSEEAAGVGAANRSGSEGIGEDASGGLEALSDSLPVLTFEIQDASELRAFPKLGDSSEVMDSSPPSTASTSASAPASSSAASSPAASSPAAAPGLAARLRDPRFLVGAGGVLLLLIALGLIALFRGGTPNPVPTEPAVAVSTPPPATKPALGSQQGWLVIDAVPWAEVIRVWDQDGREIPLTASRFTPLALQVSPGVYRVALAGAESAKPLTCEGVVVIDGGAGNCTVELPVPSADEYLKEAGWWR